MFYMQDVAETELKRAENLHMSLSITALIIMLISNRKTISISSLKLTLTASDIRSLTVNIRILIAISRVWITFEKRYVLPSTSDLSSINPFKGNRPFLESPWECYSNYNTQKTP